MILVTQGYEFGIGPEVFLKSVLCLSQEKRNQVSYFGEERTLFETCSIIGVPVETILTCGVHFHLFKRRVFVPQSSQSLALALENLTPGLDILLTLPTKKDQLVYKGLYPLGHTEFFRKKFGLKNLSMVFKCNNHYMLLLTDHMQITHAVKSINKKLIFEKVSITLECLGKYFGAPKKVLFAGINPHAGEFGLLGSDHTLFSAPIKELSKKFKHFSFIGPLSGDSLYSSASSEGSLFVFGLHDQGLAPFKVKYGLNGWNVTLGLPFLRVSPDFGTACTLYGKNCSSYMGLLDIFEKCTQTSGWKDEHKLH